MTPSQRAYDLKYRLAHPEQVRAGHVKYRAANLERARAASRLYHQSNREKLAQREAQYRRDNAAKESARGRRWRAANRGKVNAKDALYKARRMQATPRWLTQAQLAEMQLFYVNCPPGYHVDHIHPLAGVGLCGLHVPWNLQYLTAAENCRKQNRLEAN